MKKYVRRNENAEDQDKEGGSQKIQSDCFRKPQEEQGLQAPYPDEEDHKEQEEPSSRDYHGQDE
jgi:hypothetical protein